MDLKRVWNWMRACRIGNTPLIDKPAKWRRGSCGTVGAFGQPHGSQRAFQRKMTKLGLA